MSIGLYEPNIAPAMMFMNIMVFFTGFLSTIASGLMLALTNKRLTHTRHSSTERQLVLYLGIFSLVSSAVHIPELLPDIISGHHHFMDFLTPSAPGLTCAILGFVEVMFQLLNVVWMGVVSVILFLTLYFACDSAKTRNLAHHMLVGCIIVCVALVFFFLTMGHIGNAAIGCWFTSSYSSVLGYYGPLVAVYLLCGYILCYSIFHWVRKKRHNRVALNVDQEGVAWLNDQRYLMMYLVWFLACTFPSVLMYATKQISPVWGSGVNFPFLVVLNVFGLIIPVGNCLIFARAWRIYKVVMPKRWQRRRTHDDVVFGTYT